MQSEDRGPSGPTLLGDYRDFRLHVLGITVRDRRFGVRPLAVQATGSVGRDVEVKELVELVSEHRLVTLTDSNAENLPSLDRGGCGRPVGGAYVNLSHRI